MFIKRIKLLCLTILISSMLISCNNLTDESIQGVFGNNSSGNTSGDSGGTGGGEPDKPTEPEKPATPENPDGGDSGGTGGGEPEKPTTPENPDGGDSGGTGGGEPEKPTEPDTPSGGTGGAVLSCDASTVEKPIKRLIAGSSDRKIYYSDDNGTTWKKSTMPKGLPDTHIWQAFVDLGNNVVLAGSGQNNSGGIDFGGGLGIMKSSDGGQTWLRTTIIDDPFPAGLKVRDFLNLGDGIIIATADIVSGGGIWRSTDNGETWVRNEHKNSADFGQTPETADGIYLGMTSGLALLPDGRVIVTRSQQVSNGEGKSFSNPIYFSKDKGLTWYCPVKIGETDLTARDSGETIVLKNGFVLMAGRAYGSLPYSVAPYTYWGWAETTLRLNGTGTPRNVGFESITELRDGTIIAGGFSVKAPNKAEFQIPGIWRSQYFANNYWQPVADDYNFSYTQVFDSFGWQSVIGLDNCDVIAACMSVYSEGITASTEKTKCNGLYKSTDKGTTWTKMRAFDGFEVTRIIAIR